MLTANANAVVTRVSTLRARTRAAHITENTHEAAVNGTEDPPRPVEAVICATYLAADALHLHFARGLQRGAEGRHAVELDACSARHLRVVCVR